MPDALAAALAGAVATEGFGWLLAACLLAGLVRGFAGFGAALVFMPVAAAHLPPLAAITTIIVMDLLGPLPGVPGALRRAARPEVGLLLAGLCASLPLGLLALTQVPAEAFRWAVSLTVLALVGLMAAGWRYRGRGSRGAHLGAGAAGGFLGGLTGLAGPPVILWQVAGSHPAAVIRANLILYFAAVDVLFLSLLAATGRLSLPVLVLGAVLSLPFLLANLAGSYMFRWGAERAYRLLAYVIIAASALAGLPLWR